MGFFRRGDGEHSPFGGRHGGSVNIRANERAETGNDDLDNEFADYEEDDRPEVIAAGKRLADMSPEQLLGEAALSIARGDNDNYEAEFHHDRAGLLIKMAGVRAELLAHTVQDPSSDQTALT